MDMPGTPALPLTSHAAPDEMLNLSTPGGSSTTRKGWAQWRTTWHGIASCQLSAFTAGQALC